MSPAADRNLLFGILALQMDFITREQLVAAMHAWVLDKSTALGMVMVQQGTLTWANHDLLAPLVDAHIRQHNNDPQQSLAALGSASSARRDLQQVADADVQASLAAVSVGRHDDDSQATRSHSVGEASSVGARFRILRPHAEGGLGKVSVALDEELKREVALKEIKERHADDPGSRGRFLLEAEITGGLEHPGIVPVYGLGNYADGRPFYAMRFIKGDSLKEAIDRFHQSDRRASSRKADVSAGDAAHVGLTPRRSPAFDSLEFRKLLARFIDVCNAIAYAHSRGVLHRDLKPGNIMLGKYGETLVVDWGLAKAGMRGEGRGASNQQSREPGASATGEAAASARPTSLDDEQSLKPSGSDYVETVAGSAVGTPAFMSPEQAAGRLDLLGPASDVYSLGATLYALLTGKTPFSDKDTGELLRKVQRGQFPLPRQVNAEVPAPLEAVCMKAMALRAEDRYATPLALAADIEHWLADDPVSAWPEPWTVKSRRWVGRHRVFVTGAAAALVVAVIGSITANVLLSEANETISKREQEAREAGIKLAKSNEETKLAYVKLEKEQQETELARNEAQKSAKEASERADAEKKARDQIEDNLATSRMQLARGQFEGGTPGLAKEVLQLVPDKYRMSPWKNLANYVSGSLHTFRGHTEMVFSVALSADGQFTASGSWDTTVRLWDQRTGAELHTLRGHRGPVTSVAFSPDGHVLASGSFDQTVRLWSVRTGREVHVLQGHQGLVTSVAFGPDAHVVASGSHDRLVKLWDTRTGEEIRTLRGHKNVVSSVAFSPDGRVASGSGDETVRLWDAHAGHETRILHGQNPVETVTFSPDGQVVASGSRDDTVKLWNAQTGQEIRALRGHTSTVKCVAFSPDGQVVASGSFDQTVRLWDARTGQQVRILRGHESVVSGVAFSSDGQLVVSASTDRTLKLWHARISEEIRALRGHTSVVTSVAFSPNREVIASGSFDRTVRLWDAKTGQETNALRGHVNSVSCVTISPDNHVVASGSFDQTVRLWDIRTGHLVRTLTGHKGAIRSVAFSPDGKVFASAGDDNTVRLWDASSGQKIRELRGNSVTFSQDGDLVASETAQSVTLWDARTGHKIRTLLGRTGYTCNVAFSPDGQAIASGSNPASVKLWDRRKGQEIRTLRGHTDGVLSVAFSHDGQIVASGSMDQTVKLWDARTGQEIRRLRGHTGAVRCVAFGPEGLVLASGSDDGTVRLWDVRTCEEEDSLARHFWFLVNTPDAAGHRHFALQFEKSKQEFAAAYRLGQYRNATARLQLSPWDPASAVHVVGTAWAPRIAVTGWSALEDGRRAQTAFVDGATFAGILLKDSGRSAKGLVLRAQWAVDQWPEGWRNREVLGGALYRAGDYQAALKELTRAIDQRGAAKPSLWSCHFLALTHHQLGQKDQARAWFAKAILPKDAPWDEAMIDRYLRREIEAEWR